MLLLKLINIEIICSSLKTFKRDTACLDKNRSEPRIGADRHLAETPLTAKGTVVCAPETKFGTLPNTTPFLDVGGLGRLLY